MNGLKSTTPEPENPLEVWVVVVNSIIDLILFVTVPVYILFLINLSVGQRKTDGIRGSSFAVMLLANGIFDILSSVVYFIFTELPQYGLFQEFYMTDPVWKARVAKGVSLSVQFYQIISAMTIAGNRWLAINRPIAYNRLFSRRNTIRLYTGYYIATLLYLFPILVFPDMRAYVYNGQMFYGFNNPKFVLWYGVSNIIISLVSAIVWLIVYIQLAVYISNNLHKSFRQNQVKRTVAKVSAASFIFTLGTIMIFVVVFSYDTAWRFFGVDSLFPVPVYYCLIRIGQELTNLTTPWVMIAFFPEIRASTFSCRAFTRLCRSNQAVGTDSNSKTATATGAQTNGVQVRQLTHLGMPLNITGRYTMTKVG